MSARGSYMTASRADVIDRRLHELEQRLDTELDAVRKELHTVRLFNAGVLRAQVGALLDAMQSLGLRRPS